jgi:enolase
MKDSKINPFGKLRINGEQGRTIKSIKGREILDSRGNPTIEVELKTKEGIFSASVPSGASKGKYEAVELRDEDGRGVSKAIANIEKIIVPTLEKEDLTDQKRIDEILIQLDGTKNKSRLGANAILAVSMAVCRAGSASKSLPLYKHISQLAKMAENSSLPVLPKPCFNIINGGAHAENELDFQEFMIVPQENKFSKNFQMGVEIYQQLKEIIEEKFSNLAVNIGDEGGFAPPIRAPEEALDLILNAAKNLGYQEKIKIIIDIASSQFFSQGKYRMKIGEFTSEELINYYSDLIEKYPILGLEDPFSEEDWEGWQKIKLKIKNLKLKILLIGDDLLATNPERMRIAKKKDACDAMIIKPNQIGTVTEAIEAAKLAKKFDWKIIVSHRSGETEDDFIADLAVGIGAEFIKSGAPFAKERMVKYNRLVKIEEEITVR